ncbi:TetR/AcrR family transcriptional regulator [Curvibacter sp. HBC61]|uniref:TetR/AcrR family transcriptional regulator n=1 Tax=Curvibacter cyanobacteriorum TaxID=3026422 RepID=A0ABT5MVW5_9BURK|nr:TetR/AcrR family transcriptional regulator [Curvibacter sp. HBC61]MDD0838203.1 TetR/AcrR family transcriptional regulator [Curvibacter sp. HBC61]
MTRTKPAKSGAAPAATALGDSREAQLLLIARRLFAEHGFDRTSLRDIAEAAHITKAALYYYFPNKDALYERIVLESVELLHDKVAAAVSQAQGPVARVRAFMETSAEFQGNARDRWIAGSNAFWQAARGGQRMAALKLRDSYEQLLRRCLREGMEAGLIRPVDAAMAGRFLLSALNQMPRWHRPDGRLETAQVMREYMDMLLNGLLVDKQVSTEANKESQKLG